MDTDNCIKMVDNLNKKRTVRVYCDGIYDLFHSGHSNQFKQVHEHKQLEGYHVFLIIGVCNDKDTLQFKGPTVMTNMERVEAIQSCKYVDQVIPNAPWILTPEFLEQYNIDLVAHDSIPYAAPGQTDVYGWIKKEGKFLTTQRTEGISTSDLILRIVQNYDVFCKRLIDRGYTADDLRLSGTDYNHFKNSNLQ